MSAQDNGGSITLGLQSPDPKKDQRQASRQAARSDSDNESPTGSMSFNPNKAAFQ